MSAHVIDEFVVLGKYRVMVLDRSAYDAPHAKYLINGHTYAPVLIHERPKPGPVPLNYIAVKSTKSFVGSTVEFI